MPTSTNNTLNLLKVNVMVIIIVVIIVVLIMMMIVGRLFNVKRPLNVFGLLHE